MPILDINNVILDINNVILDTNNLIVTSDDVKFWYQELNCWYQEIHYWYQKLHSQLLIWEEHFQISEINIVNCKNVIDVCKIVYITLHYHQSVLTITFTFFISHDSSVFWDV